MADAAPSAAKRFSEDLRRIREVRDISVDDIHSETQIARTIIESFEGGDLYDHPTYNRVYLRSFIKAYSEAIGIAQDDALRGLDAALRGTYDEALSAQYLSDEAGADSGEAEEADGAEPTAADEEQDASASGEGPSGRGGIVGPPRAVGEAEDPSIEDVSSPDAKVQGVEDEGEEATANPDASSEPEPPSEREGASDPEPFSETSEWGEVGEPDSDVEADQGGLEQAPPSEISSEPVDSDEESEDAAADEEFDAEAARQKLEETSGPEALRSSPDEEDSESGSEEAFSDADDSDAAGEEDVPAWMQESEDVEESSEPPPSSVGEAPDFSDGGEGGTGIVGEPTAMGEGGARAGGGAPSPQSGPRSGSSTSEGFWGGVNQQVYVTGIGIVVVLLVLIGVGIVYFSSGEAETASPTPSSSDQPASAPDTAATTAPSDTAAVPSAADTAAEADAENRPPPADVTLGEQIHLLVYATDPVRRIHIQRDDDLRRPYWIEAKEASVFPFERRVILRQELDKARLYIEGYRYPISPADTVGGLELTRSTLSAFVDTLRGEPASLSVSPDTIRKGNPVPDTTSATAGEEAGEETPSPQ